MSHKPWSRSYPFHAQICEQRRLNKPGSDKETHHVVIDLLGSGLSYECGDALGVWPENSQEDVKVLIERLGADPSCIVKVAGKEDMRFDDALTRSFALYPSSPRFIHALCDRLPHGSSEHNLLLETVSDTKVLQKALAVRSYMDWFDLYAVNFSPQEFIDVMRPIVPRLYSIASSPSVSPHQADLTIARVDYVENGTRRIGIASNFLLREDIRNVSVYIHPSKNFSLPEDQSQDIIMVGPGTGIAPFRAFLQERSHGKGHGRNWLFFGDRRRDYDFLYEDDLRSFEETHLLTHLDLAFSRDQKEKVYVQDLMHQKGAILWDWIKPHSDHGEASSSYGARFYVCGDAMAMAKDVNQALMDIIILHGSYTEKEARSYIRSMRSCGQYQRDVY